MNAGKQPLNIPIRLENGKEGYQLVEAFSYHWEAEGGSWFITIPEGFVSDGASVPRLVWTISGIRPDGLIRSAALVHDFICHYEGDLPFGSFYGFKNGVWHDWSNNKWSWKNAARLFARIMRECGVSKLQRRIAYLAVRFFKIFKIFGW